MGFWGASAGGSAADGSGDGKLRVASYISNQWNYLDRWFFLFDTSSIGTGQQVDSATLGIVLRKITSDPGFGLSWNVYSSNPASNTALVAADHSTLGAVPFSTARVVNDESTSFTRVDFALNTAGKNAVDMEGISKFGAATIQDRENATYGDPTWVNASEWRQDAYFSDFSGTANDPLLTVTHSAVATGSPHYYSSSIQGAI